MEPEFFTGEQMRAALAARDIGIVYRLLRRVGLSQRRIAPPTGQSSEVSKIPNGRQVSNAGDLRSIGLEISCPPSRTDLSASPDLLASTDSR